MDKFNEHGFSFKEQILAIVAGLLIVAIVGWFLPLGSGSRALTSGGTGAQYIEDYDPLVMQAGLNTNKAVSFGSTLAVSGATTLSGATNLTGAVALTSSFTLGTNGTSLSAIKTGSCTIWAPGQTITATSTQQVECQGATNGSISAITGITTDSICQLNNASSTNTTYGGIAVGGVSASSTAGTIVGRIVNLTGTTFTWDATASSSAKWQYSCFDPS